MDNKIPTAEEYIINQGFATWAVQDSPDTTEVVINYQDCLQAMEEFAKLHVEAALQAAAEKALVHQKCNQYHSGEEMWSDKSGEVSVTVRNENSYDEHHCIVVDKDSILNAYPLNNIK